MLEGTLMCSTDCVCSTTTVGGFCRMQVETDLKKQTLDMEIEICPEGWLSLLSMAILLYRPGHHLLLPFCFCF
jgi:hypothetical protein